MENHPLERAVTMHDIRDVYDAIERSKSFTNLERDLIRKRLDRHDMYITLICVAAYLFYIFFVSKKNEAE
jgi:hypothetical protein